MCNFWHNLTLDKAHSTKNCWWDTKSSLQAQDFLSNQDWFLLGGAIFNGRWNQKVHIYNETLSTALILNCVFVVLSDGNRDTEIFSNAPKQVINSTEAANMTDIQTIFNPNHFSFLSSHPNPSPIHSVSFKKFTVSGRWKRHSQSGTPCDSDSAYA